VIVNVGEIGNANPEHDKTITDGKRQGRFFARNETRAYRSQISSGRDPDGYWYRSTHDVRHPL